MRILRTFQEKKYIIFVISWIFTLSQYVNSTDNHKMAINYISKFKKFNSFFIF